MDGQRVIRTNTLQVDARHVGKVTALPAEDDILDGIDICLASDGQDAANLQLAASQLRCSNVPVAFPTETVYGLGADATRSEAVKGIYTAKQRPADNPLIVHFSSLKQLRTLLQSDPRDSMKANGLHVNGEAANDVEHDPIPDIYKPLISRFWPGPLTIILPNPPKSPLAPEVTAGLDTFGARMPRHILALALIHLAGRPIAAPSANASTRPSPTAAEHVFDDLNGRIETIVDGGPCDVGVESTVVDGLSMPPLILRPGGISLEQVRSCPGWEDTQVGYKDISQRGDRPKAPGMKYRHYSPRAKVILYEAGKCLPSFTHLLGYLGSTKKLGLITTQRWKVDAPSPSSVIHRTEEPSKSERSPASHERLGFAGMLESLHNAPDPGANLQSHLIKYKETAFEMLEIALGGNTTDIARGVFSALRELDRERVDAILVEGIEEDKGDTAAAVMNRLRKAAEINVHE